MAETDAGSLHPREPLALDGGAPVRTQPMPPCFVGATMIGEEEKRLVNEALDAQCLFRHYGPGKPHFVADFEHECADMLGVRHVLAVSTGSGACFCAMRALGVGPGDEVIIPSFGWIPDYSMVDHLGATPVFAGIDTSLNLSPEAFEARITPRTKAVVIVYYQGGASRVDEIVAIARRHRIRVLEDNAQALGGTFAGRKLGAWGDISCSSLQTNKIITSGEGGLVATNDRRLYETCVRYHDLGLFRDAFKAAADETPITEPLSGYQWRMGELAGAVALAQLRKLPGMVATCRRHAATLRAALARAFPVLRFRAVDPENDIGILLAFDLKTPDHVDFFARAYTAEGLHYGPTSWCEAMCDIPPVKARMPFNGVYTEETFARTKALDARYGKLALVPSYTDADVRDMAEGALKVLGAMQERGRLS